MSINSFNPFGQHGYVCHPDRRGTAVAARDHQRAEDYRAVVRRSFEIGSRCFDWEVGYQYNRNELESVTTGNLHKGRVAGVGRRSHTPPPAVAVRHRRPRSPDVCKPWNHGSAVRL